jgi:hypothetical protein
MEMQRTTKNPQYFKNVVLVAPKLSVTRTGEEFAENIDAIVATDPEAGWVFVCDNLNTHLSVTFRHIEIGGKSVTIRMVSGFYGLLGDIHGKLHGQPKKVFKFTVIIAYRQSPAGSATYLAHPKMLLTKHQEYGQFT